MYKKVEAFFKKHPTYCALVHIVTGIGLGILITYPFVATHPVRMGGAFLLLGLAGYLYPFIVAKK